MQQTPYGVLGVAPTATLEEAHAAWRRLCAIYHPDRYQNASQDVRAEAERRRLALCHEAGRFAALLRSRLRTLAAGALHPERPLRVWNMTRTGRIALGGGPCSDGTRTVPNRW